MSILIRDPAFQVALKAEEAIIRNFAKFGIPDAQELIDRSKGKNNLQAHEKHLLRVAVAFLRAKPKIAQIVRSHTSLDEVLDGRQAMWDSVANEFCKFVRRRGGDIASSTMRSNNPLTVTQISVTYLPDTWAGSHITGGAGASTLKRAIKLLAHALCA